MSAAMHPAVAQVRAIRIAREIEEAEGFLRTWQRMERFGDQVVQDMILRKDERWRALCRQISDGICETVRLKVWIDRARTELCELLANHDILIPGA